MDAFFASVEQRDNPELRGKPIAVGFDGPRGVVSTASYEARRYGVRSAMSIARAKQLCRNLLIVPHHGEAYKEASEMIMQIFHDYTDMVEPLSIDEAFLDVTENKAGISDATAIAVEIKQKIFDTTRLTASAGVSYNKFLAKIASDYRKPDGLCVISEDEARDFIDSLPVDKFWGVGPKTAALMRHIGVFTGRQLRDVSRQHLVEVFGKAGNMYYDFAHGIDTRPVTTSWDRKSVGCEQTFLTDINLRSAIIIELYHIVIELIERIEKADFHGKTLTLKVKFADFQQITRSFTSDKVLERKRDILPIAKRLMSQVEYSGNPIRLIGLSVSNPATGAKKRWAEGWLPFS